MLENALAAGIMSLGVDASSSARCDAGVAYITRSLRADAGIVLSASHNPYEDNGIKFFRHDGYKLDDEIESRIENLVFSGEIESIRPTAGKNRPGDAHRRRARALRRVRQTELPARPDARRTSGSPSIAPTGPPTNRRRASCGARGGRHRSRTSRRTGGISTGIAQAPTPRKSSGS